MSRPSAGSLAETSTKPFGVFVYGTLKPGEENYDRYCEKWVTQVKEATVLGQLFDLVMGYPALTPGDGLVYGFLLSFVDPAVLTLLDDLEDYDPSRPLYQNTYLRVKTEVLDLNGQSLGKAWIYQMQPQRVAQARGILLPAGRWSNQIPPSLPS